ncbi:right-handed parallel beta-helix repeat-containing protein [Aestuariibacter sp. AA17]|uniref:Right-handed parallel beta-helix repeat-containing protein n=1 Tax=Fluctibacter corallii TaxID=2984329 RepID=A0ABT3A606_9ALTE|nr:parallel beta-helix domain-containing protein [Aestuariibacter sp. AA17]MCV2884089.1 right-handed parallel beta-helix repeat-containing protein [Aestuariibacter sp. AA17]
MVLKVITSTVLVLAGVGIGYGISQSNSSMPSVAPVAEKSFEGGYKQADDLDAVGQQNTADAYEVSGVTHHINPGESIMEVVKAANPGDTIVLAPGRYHETVYIDKDSITLRGIIQEGKRAILDGEGTLNDAILYSGNNIVVENLQITRYKGNGIMGQAGNNFEIRNNVIVDTGVYGIFPQLGKNGVVEHNVISGIEDAAIYVGMSDNIHVAHNEVFDSVAGIEIENSRHAIVENNYVHNNTGGLLAFITPGLPIKTTYDVIFRNNYIANNNTPNFGAPGSTVSGIPAGTGILIMAADDVIIEGNIIKDNKTAGIIITDHDNAPNTTIDPDADPKSDRIRILDNLMVNNGYDTIDEAKALLLTEFKTGHPDIIRVGANTESCILNKQQYVTAGLKDWAQCDFTNTDTITTYLLDTPVAPRDIHPSERGKIAYLGICTGCHTYTGRMIGPPVEVIQALYMDDPQSMADWIANPVKKRDDYPEMPPQNYLDPDTRLAVAKYMLSVKNEG